MSACNATKKKFGDITPINKAWHKKYSNTPYIGSCMDLCRRLKPENYEDFFKKYTAYAEEHKNEHVSKRGLTIDEIYELADAWRNDSIEMGLDKDFDIAMFIYAALCHIIVETYDGWVREKAFRKYIEDAGFKCHYVENKLDRKYGVDMLISDTDAEKWFALQVKPISFVTSEREDTVKDKMALCKKHDKLKLDKSLDTYYVIYDGGKWLKRKDNGKFLFRVDELFGYDSNDVASSFRLRMTKDELKKRTELTTFNT